MAIKHKIKFKNDQARGTSPAELCSSGPKRQATTPGVSGESTGRSVSADDNEYQSGGAYKAMLKLFNHNLEDEKYAEHCRKFFKGDDENNT